MIFVSEQKRVDEILQFQKIPIHSELSNDLKKELKNIF
jgi:hypothetical protein